MSYQVFARTWRPQTFSQIVGQDHIVTTLKNIISSQRIGHAYLFSGTRGVGKTSVARIFAKALNCSNPKELEPCNECSSCQEISKSSSIDVMEIDGASNNGVNSIRDLREQVGYLPTSCKFKIYIIDEVHMLTESAFNALLKTLEEPPEHVLFMFATTEAHEIPATILSRCQRFNFRKVSRREIVDHIKKITTQEQISISNDGINIIAKEANGSIRDALSLLEQVVSFGNGDISDKMVLDSIGLVDQELINNTIRALFAHDMEKIIQTVQTIYEYGYDHKTFLATLLQQLRNVLITKLRSNKTTLLQKQYEEFIDLPQEELKELENLAQCVQDDNAVHRIFFMINESVNAILSSVLPQVTLETVLLRAARVKSGLSPQSILERLEELESKSSMKQEYTVQPEQRKKSQNNETANVAKKEKQDTAQLSEWEKLVSAVRSKKPLLAANLEEGTLIDFIDAELKLIYPTSNFSYQQVTDAENKADIEKLISAYLNKQVKLIVDLGDPEEIKTEKKINLQKMKQEKEEEGLKTLKETATTHPNIELVKNVLEGEISKVEIIKNKN